MENIRKRKIEEYIFKRKGYTKKMRSIVLLICLMILFSLNNATKITNVQKSGRTIRPETVDFQLIYLGSCSKFFSIPNIQISSRTDNCLPVNVNAPYSDVGDLDAHVLCTDIGRNRAQIDFVEIFLIYGTPLTTGFTMSFASNAPYKATAQGVAYLRRPNCEIDQDFCSTRDYIRSCNENLVTLKNGFVVNKDLVYIVPQGSDVVGCSSAQDTCCAYITPGFCPRSGDDSLFRIKFNQNNHGYGHGGHGGHGGNGGHNSYGNRPQTRPPKPHTRPPTHSQYNKNEENKNQDNKKTKQEKVLPLIALKPVVEEDSVEETVSKNVVDQNNNDEDQPFVFSVQQKPVTQTKPVAVNRPGKLVAGGKKASPVAAQKKDEDDEESDDKKRNIVPIN
eukprot:TRINITY_DN204_c0_g1_i1.p1 TRINITY_DN204_c0_g1~~TRINITY_DN204_c0_g1_i1.p1  ORF type:complete len:391 (-),score=100.87 TRINITY_DN204_c0_g1_i1:47-1219(-)